MYSYTDILSEEPDKNNLKALGASIVYSQHKKMVPQTSLQKEDVEVFNVAYSKANDGQYIIVILWKSKSGKY